jgi:hypothetical protein
MRRRIVLAGVFGFGVLSSAGVSRAGPGPQISVVSSGGFAAAYRELAPRFEHST